MILSRNLAISSEAPPPLAISSEAPPPLVISTGAKRSGEICGSSKPRIRGRLNISKAIFATFVLSILSVPVPTLKAQRPALPQLTIEVTDQNGAVIPGALVAVTDSAGVPKTAAYTKADGSALFPLTPGHYEISTRVVGFLSSQQEIDFPKTNLVTLALMISNDIECGPCVNPTPIFLEATQPVITALVPYESLSNLPLRLKSHRILTTKEPQ